MAGCAREGEVPLSLLQSWGAENGQIYNTVGMGRGEDAALNAQLSWIVLCGRETINKERLWLIICVRIYVQRSFGN
jgi:hypothetical protein